VNQTLLFVIGAGVFAITVCATLYYGYVLFDRSYQADVEEQPSTRELIGALEPGVGRAGGARPVTSASASA